MSPVWVSWVLVLEFSSNTKRASYNSDLYPSVLRCVHRTLFFPASFHLPHAPLASSAAALLAWALRSFHAPSSATLAVVPFRRLPHHSPRVAVPAPPSPLRSCAPPFSSTRSLTVPPSCAPPRPSLRCHSALPRAQPPRALHCTLLLCSAAAHAYRRCFAIPWRPRVAV